MPSATIRYEFVMYIHIMCLVLGQREIKNIIKRLQLTKILKSTVLMVIYNFAKVGPLGPINQN